MYSNPWIHGSMKNPANHHLHLPQNGRPVISCHFLGISCSFLGISCPIFLKKWHNSWNFKSPPWTRFMGHPCKTIIFNYHPWKVFIWNTPAKLSFLITMKCLHLQTVFRRPLQNPHFLITVKLLSLKSGYGHPCKTIIVWLPWNYCPCKLFSEHHCKNGLNGSFLNDNPCKSLYNNHWSIEHPCMNSYPWNVFMGHTWKACSIWSVHHIPEWFRIYNDSGSTMNLIHLYSPHEVRSLQYGESRRLVLTWFLISFAPTCF